MLNNDKNNVDKNKHLEPIKSQSYSSLKMSKSDNLGLRKYKKKSYFRLSKKKLFEKINFYKNKKFLDISIKNYQKRSNKIYNKNSSQGEYLKQSFLLSKSFSYFYKNKNNKNLLIENNNKKNLINYFYYSSDLGIEKNICINLNLTNISNLQEMEQNKSNFIIIFI